MTQLSIDFVHTKENNRESLNNLNEKRIHFNDQCKTIFNFMMSGGVMTTRSAIIDFNIQSFIRRKHDLTDKGVMISERKIADSGAKEYFMDTFDRLANQKYIQYAKRDHTI